jgi:hypothetical protein
MPGVQRNDMPASLHYDSTDFQCSISGERLEWAADF